MASTSTLMAGSSKMAAHKPAASALSRTVKRPPKDFKGCGCQISKCVNKNCPCPKNGYPCTLRCKCKGCKNKLGARGTGDPTDGPYTKPVRQWCRCAFSNCANKNCHCFKRSRRCTSKCKCDDCSNLPGGGGSKPDEAVRHAEELLMNEGPDPEVGEDAIGGMVTDLLKEIKNKGSDLNKLP